MLKHQKSKYYIKSNSDTNYLLHIITDPEGEAEVVEMEGTQDDLEEEEMEEGITSTIKVEKKKTEVRINVSVRIENKFYSD